MELRAYFKYLLRRWWLAALPVLVVAGDGRALKVTTPDDLDRAQRLAHVLSDDDSTHDDDASRR